MTALDDHLDTVEKHGFVRGNFPLSYNGHRLEILQNDAFIEDDRLVFDFALYCDKCKCEDGISGRLPVDDERQVERVSIAKVVTFGNFKYRECV